MDLKPDKTEKQKSVSDNSESNLIELKGKESKMILDKEKLGWNLPMHDVSKRGNIDRMSVDSFWVESSDDEGTDIEIEINEDENLKFNVKLEEVKETKSEQNFGKK